MEEEVGRFEACINSLLTEMNNSHEDTPSLLTHESLEAYRAVFRAAEAESEAELLREEINQINVEYCNLKQELGIAFVKLNRAQDTLRESKRPLSPTSNETRGGSLSSSPSRAEGCGAEETETVIRQLENDLINTKLTVAEMATKDTRLKRKLNELEQTLAQTK